MSDKIDENSIILTSVTQIKQIFSELFSEKASLYEKPVVKSIDTDKKLFTAVVLRPNTVDAHGDIYDEEAVEKACYDYNEFCRQGNLQHLMQTELVVPVESWVSKTDHILGEGEVKKGDWLMTVRVDNDEIWDMCKKGEFTGFSIGCKSLVEDLNNDDS